MSVHATALLFSACGLILYTGARLGIWAPKSTAALAEGMGATGKIERVALVGAVVGLLAVAGLLLLAGGCGRGGETAGPAADPGRSAVAPPGPAAPAASGSAARTAPGTAAPARQGFLGVLLARETVDVAAEASGR